MEKKCVVLGVTGSIAAYKAAEIVSTLKKINIQTHVIMTLSATKFVAPLTFESLSANPVCVSMFEEKKQWEIEHIALAKKADLFVVAPASANFIGKFANGIADDMLTTTAMATTAKVLIAPAMNTNMFLSKQNRANIKKLENIGCEFVEPDTGLLACNDVGIGKLSPVSKIVSKIVELLNVQQDLVGKNILITAGPTRELIDPVRFISNRSSGKMGYEIAKAAQIRGANVTLISGPVKLSPPQNVETINVQSTQEMFEAVVENFSKNEIIIKAAAPCDFTPKTVFQNKIKKNQQSQNNNFSIEFEKTPDILKYIGENKKNAFVCGFAAETQNVEQYAIEKIRKKNLNMIVANDVSQKGAGFDVDTNIATFFFQNGEKQVLPIMEKAQLAHKILNEIVKKL